LSYPGSVVDLRVDCIAIFLIAASWRIGSSGLLDNHLNVVRGLGDLEARAHHEIVVVAPATKWHESVGKCLPTKNISPSRDNCPEEASELIQFLRDLSERWHNRSPAYRKPNAVYCDRRIMRLDARGFHQGQGLRAQDLPFELELAILAPQLGQLFPLGGGQAAIAAGIVPIRSLDPLADRPGSRSETLRQLIEAASGRMQRHHLAAKLRRVSGL
jgi:hypothetical protein